ncbi:uncharacterized protein HaLaN_01973 [Haematococcus lacustris]|uniref:Signal recognition particle receptor subunit beta n=1 Tax=Haematococcus lacustris TaxID=44745 RepID=A0A699YCU8_HAELA|nr:uncharacterized protein HaLaN_01973 [Haematococcus lacustris]
MTASLPTSVAQLLPQGIADALNDQRPAVLLALAVVVLTVLLLAVVLPLLKSNRTRGSLIVVAGPCGSGKTTLFYQLRDGSTHNGTVASMQENSGEVLVKGDKGRTVGKVTLLDVPGHERLRHRLEQHLKDAAAVIFVVDAADIMPHKVEAAEELFEVLTHPSVCRRRVPLLLACNKSDLDTQAHSLDFVRRTIERQLDAMRKTRATVSPEMAAKAALLGKAGDAGGLSLSLDKLRSPVSAVECSALTGQVQALHAFLAGFAR